MFWRQKRERDLDAEIAAHLEMDVEERGGDRLAARKALGNTALVREETRAVWTWTWLEQLIQDLRYAGRTLRAHPGFTAAAVLSVALGIGANTAIFTLIDALLLRSLPVRNPGELVQLHLVEMGRRGNSFGYPSILALAQRTDVFASVGGFSGATFNLTAPEGSERVSGAWVTGGYYPALGVETVAGRLLGPEDDRPGATPAAVLSYSYWERRYGRDFGVIGRTISLDGVPVRIVGVSARGFEGANVGDAANVTLALGILPQLYPERVAQLESGSQWLRVVARPAPGLSAAQAKARMAVIWPRMAAIATTPRMNAKRREVILASGIDVSEGGSGWSYLREQFRQPLLVLLVVTGLVLLIACANFANLLLVRGSSRAREIALRFAIGAGRGRVMRQLLTESLILALAGAGLGILLAGAGSRALVALLSSGRRDLIVLDLRPDGTVLMFTTAVALMTGVLFGLVPALRATASGPGAVLKSNSGITPRAGSRMLAPVVVLQVAVSLVLLIGAGLFVRTLQNLHQVPMGFRHEGVLLVNVDGQRAGYKGPAVAAFYRDLMERFSRLPGVRSVSASANTPLSGGIWTDDVIVDDVKTSAHFNSVSPRFFETMGTPLVAGRDFTEQDEAAGARNVCIVNQAFVRKYADAVGLGGQVSTVAGKLPMEVVGIVGDTVFWNLREAEPPAVYVPHFKEGSRIGFTSIEIHGEGSLNNVAELVRGELRAEIPRTAVQAQVVGLTEQVERTLIQERLLAALGSAFGVLALVLAAVGLYGLLAYTVSRATSEIGIRLALGAQRVEVVWLIMRGALKLTSMGVAVGVPAGWAASRLVASTLFGLRPGDLASLAGAAVLLAATALAAAWLPARKASKVDPMVALRWE